MSSFTFPSSTRIEFSETDFTSRFRAQWNDDECLSVQLDNILNPNLDANKKEKNILLILDKLHRSERDSSYEGHAFQHALDEIVYVITADLMSKHKKTERAIKKFKKHFSAGSDISTWLIQHEYALIFDSELFDLKQYVGTENENFFWLTMKRIITKYFQLQIETERAEILNWPSIFNSTFKRALSEKIKQMAPNQDTKASVYRFDDLNFDHSVNKMATKWYEEFLCKEDLKMDNKQKAQFIRQQTKKICDGCGQCIKINKAQMKRVIIYSGGWPKAQRFMFHDDLCVVW